MVLNATWLIITQQNWVWVSVLVCALIAAVVVIAAATGIALALAYYLGARWAVAVAIAWGLAWISINRFTGELQSTIVGVAGAIGAVIVLASPLIFRGRREAAPAPDRRPASSSRNS